MAEEVNVVKEGHGFYLSEDLDIYILNSENVLEFFHKLNLEGFNSSEEAWDGFIGAFEITDPTS